MIGLVEKQNAPLVRRANSGGNPFTFALCSQYSILEHKVKPRTTSPTPQEVG